MTSFHYPIATVHKVSFDLNHLLTTVTVMPEETPTIATGSEGSQVIMNAPLRT